MAEQQALRATFYAFRKRERGGMLLRAAVAFAISAALLMAAFVALFWTSIGPVLSWYGEIIVAAINQDTAAIQNIEFPMEFFGFVGGLMLWMFPFYILCAAFEAACLRWMIHGENVGFMGLSLGAPTWRVWCVYWMWFLLNLAFSLVMGVATAVLAGAIVLSTGAAESAASITPVLELIQYGVMIYFGVRLAPAAATTIARRKFAFFDAWTVTKGRFWALFGSFAVLWLLYLLASVVLTVVWFTTMMSGVVIDWAGLGDPARMTEAVTGIVEGFMQSLLEPRSWALMGLVWLASALVGLVFYIACYGVNARAAAAALEEGTIKPAGGG